MNTPQKTVESCAMADFQAGQYLTTEQYLAEIKEKANNIMIDWNRAVQTSCGRNVNVIWNNSGHPDFPIIVLIDHKPYMVSRSGIIGSPVYNLHPQLINVPEEISLVRYCNIYKNSDFTYAFPSKDTADNYLSNHERIACIKVEIKGKVGQFDD